MVLSLRLRVLYGYQNRQRLLPYTTLTEVFCITKVESVYCAVRTESLYKTDTLVLKVLMCPFLSPFDALAAISPSYEIRRCSTK